MIILGVRNFRVFEILEHLPYDVETWYRSEFHYNSKFTLMSKIVWNNYGRYKEG